MLSRQFGPFQSTSIDAHRLCVDTVLAPGPRGGYDRPCVEVSASDIGGGGGTSTGVRNSGGGLNRTSAIMGSRVAAAHFPDKYLAGVPQLLEDLQRLSEDTDSADILFLVGREEAAVYAHRVILMAR
ncbi:hypothetical protein M8J77_020775 [Diaphorina citri]|nr:hypothetical protein M8J77_020775 [Diaphorina citri]